MRDASVLHDLLKIQCPNLRQASFIPHDGCPAIIARRATALTH